jgi:hypothetical protein
MDDEIRQIAEAGVKTRPTAYNRRWHLDEDGRRHQGERQWDPAAVEAFVALAATVDWLYPPDWSDRDAVRFRAAGGNIFAELWTDSPEALRLVLPNPQVYELHFSAAAAFEGGDFRREFVARATTP